MSDAIKHECGIGLIRLLKPLDYYAEHYNSALWGLNKMYLLMEKQRNRGQDGAGLGVVKLNMKPGFPYMHRMRYNQQSPWSNLFKNLNGQLDTLRKQDPDRYGEASYLKQNFKFAGEVLLGHLRYGTHGDYGIAAVHPVYHIAQYQNRSLMMAGNFNLTNVDYLFKKLVELGQHPNYMTDTETVMERVGHYLSIQNEQLYRKYKKEGFTRAEIAQLISEGLNLPKIMKRVASAWDGGYAIAGAVGNGDSFVIRDPNGIRPVYYYHNDEFVVAASERPAICTVFNLQPEEVPELPPGHILAVKGRSKEIKLKAFTKPGEKLSCSFERIYFSRGNDVDIYQERKQLGRQIVPKLLEAIENDIENTVFSYIPNTAESAFIGMVDELESQLTSQKTRQLLKLAEKKASEKQIAKVLNVRVRVDKAILKDVKMRTFITDDSSRDDLVAHVYDITKGILVPEVDNLVALDDSIVRGTTLQKSILNMLQRLRPKKIVIVSSAPQIRFPDCYGIDMSKIDKLVAFQAAISLLRERKMENIIDRVYEKIKEAKADGVLHERNIVKEIYQPFSEEEISARITEIVRPKDFPMDLEIIYQPLENLSKAIPNHRGDWYFSGNYPTPGGNRVVNQAYLNFYEGRSERAYQYDLA